jgi:predicted nucleic acid-binding protein
MFLTIDTSAILAVLVNEKHKSGIIQQTQDCSLQSPVSLDAEIGNALSAMIRRERITIDEAKTVARQFELVPIRRTPIRLAEALELSNAYGIYAYDGYVLDCAMHYKTPLLSLDSRMIEVAKQLQIQVLEVLL